MTLTPQQEEQASNAAAVVFIIAFIGGSVLILAAVEAYSRVAAQLLGGFLLLFVAYQAGTVLSKR